MTLISDEMRSTFGAIADILIPESEGMPSASQVQVHGKILDHILGLRPDLAEDFVRGINSAIGKDPKESTNELNQEDSTALRAIGLIASSAYYMDQKVRQLIGYPGQQKLPASDPDATPEYVENGMLQQVIDRGSIYRPTPK